MKKLLLAALFTGISVMMLAQNNVGIGTNSPNPNAKLDISSTTKGLLMPRMTTAQRTTLAGTLGLSDEGLIIYDTDLQKFFYWDKNIGFSGDWNQVRPGSLSDGKIWIGDPTNTAVERNMSGDVTMSDTGLATIQPNAVQGTDISLVGESTGNIMQFNGTDWVPVNPNSIAWSLLGNAGTVAATNFIGTTDAIDFVTRTNNMERMRVSNSGRVGINTATTGLGSTYPWANLEIVGDGATNGDILLKSIGPICDYLVWQTAGGSYPTPALVGTNQLIGYLDWQAYNGTGYSTAASLTTFIEGAPTSTSLPTAISFNTTPSGAITSLERLRITNAGNVGIGISNPTNKLEVVGKTKTDSFQLTTGATNNYILRSDASGNGTWVNPNTLGITNTLTNPTNTITSTVNGVSATAPAVNTVANTSATNTLSTTVNGVAGAGVNIINSNALTSATNTMTSTINGVASNAPIVNSNSLSSAVNTITSTVNGVSATAPAVNSVSNTSSANTMSTTINGVAGATVPIINTNTLTVSAGALTSTVNGVASSPAIDLNASLIKRDIVPNTGSVVTVSNGTNQVVGATNVTVDVQGTAGGVLYGKGAGTAAAFTGTGTTTQVLHGNGAGAPSFGAVVLTSDVSGILPIANGGTNSSATPTAGGIGYGTGTAHAYNSAGTTGQILQSGVAGAPTWIDKTAILNTQNGLSTVTTGGSATATTPYAELGGSLYKSTTITQGAFPLAFTSTATNGFSVDGTTFSVDAANDRVGLGTNAPTQRLTVNGNIDFPNYNNPIIGFPSPVIGNHGTLTLQAGSNVFSGIAYTGGNIAINAGNMNISGATAGSSGNVVISAGVNTFDASGGGEITLRTGLSTTTPTERMRIKSNGNVGIGNTNPTSSLYVGSGAIGGGVLAGINVSVGAGSYVTTSNGTITSFIGADGSGYAMGGSLTNHDYVIRSNNAERIRVLAAGNVGIGATTPAVRLAVDGNGTNVYNTSIWSENNIHVQGNETMLAGGRGRLRVGNAWQYAGLYAEPTSTGANNDLVLGASSGLVRVGPGTGQNLFVSGKTYSINTSNVYERATTAGGIWGGESFWAAAGIAGAHIYNSENEQGGFYADGNYAAIYNPGDNDLLKIMDEDGFNNAGDIFDNGSVKARIDGAGAYFQVSDRNAKMNILPIQNALTKINQISGYTYEFIRNDKEIAKGQKPIPSAGIIAQEVEKILPEAVSNDDGHYMVNYAAITPLLIQAIKEQQVIIDDLKKRLEAIEQK